MAHLSEDGHPLTVKHVVVERGEDLIQVTRGFTDVCVLILPPCTEAGEYRKALHNVGSLVADVAGGLGEEATLVTVGEVIDLIQVQASMSSAVRYQQWIVIKRPSPQEVDTRSLPNYHFGALIHTRYEQSLRHTKTRIAYTYCPACDKTTKDYGGKKHTYHQYGTLASDVWRDIPCDLEGDISPVITRFRDLFGIEPYQELLVLDCRQMDLDRISVQYSAKPDWNEKFIVGGETLPEYDQLHLASQASFLQHPDYDLSGNEARTRAADSRLPAHLINQVLHGDCLEWLYKIPDDTIDFVFTDPPYNLGKNTLAIVMIWRSGNTLIGATCGLPNCRAF